MDKQRLRYKAHCKVSNYMYIIVTHLVKKVTIDLHFRYLKSFEVEVNHTTLCYEEGGMREGGREGEGDKQRDGEGEGTDGGKGVGESEGAVMTWIKRV